MHEFFMARPARASIRIPRPLSLPTPVTITIVVTVAAATAALCALTPQAQLPSPLMFLFWAGLLALTESLPVRLPRGGFITVSAALAYAAVVLFGPVAAAWMAVVAGLVAQGFVQRRRPTRVAFELAAGALAILAAGAVFQLLGGLPGRFELPAALPAFVTLALVDFVVRTGLVSCILGLGQNRRPWGIWRVSFGWSMLYLTAFVPLGMVAVLAQLEWGGWAVVLFLLPLAVVHRALRQHADLREEQLGFSTALIDMVGEIDPYTSRHSLRVAAYAEQLASAMRLPEPEVERIRLGALLHDLGKVAQERGVLAKPTRLSDYERLCMQAHPGTGARLMAHVPSLRAVADIVRHHHERIDGKGYPDGLRGEEIPLGARVVLVADAFDAMTSTRSYRSGMPVARALAEMERQQHRQFDPRVVATLRELVDTGELVVVRGRIGDQRLRRTG